jgi:hypothetical protein
MTRKPTTQKGTLSDNDTTDVSLDDLYSPDDEVHHPLSGRVEANRIAKSRKGKIQDG